MEWKVAEYSITMKRSHGLSNAEVRARLGRVYALLLDLARREEGRPTADGVETGNQTQATDGAMAAGRGERV